MILRTDILETLKIDIMYSTNTIMWDGSTIPMKERRIIAGQHNHEMYYHIANNPPIIQQAESQQNAFLTLTTLQSTYKST